MIGPDSTISSALRLMERGGAGILLLVDRQGVLQRTITDGDLRRLWLQREDVNAPIGELPEKPPVSMRRAEFNPAAALAQLNAFQVDELPLLDDAGRPVGLLLRRDLDNEIFLSTPHLGDFERDYVEQAFTSNWVAPLGPNVDAFERDVADYVGIPHAAALSSGTAAIHLALCLLGVRAGDTVFCSSLTFVASANPILYQQARPVFIDSERASWNMCPRTLERALEEAQRARQLPKAVIVVNLYGQSADMDPLLELCERYGVPMVEDAAESLGATYKGRASGSFGRMGVFSFNGNKIITTSGGGMLVSADEALVAKARFLATQARDQAGHYQHSEVGYNYRMSNILAGVGRGQMRVLEQRVAARRAVFERYQEGLGSRTALSWMPEAAFGRSTRWLSTAVLDPARTALTPPELIAKLAEERIEARRLWKPMHLQPLFAGCAYYPAAEGSVSDDLFERGVCLPSGSNMTVAQQERVIEALARALDA